MRAIEIEKLVKSIVKKIYKMYPSVEWEDLEAQAWLIVTKKIGYYDEDRGASLSTYLYSQVSGELQKYVERIILKQLNMKGLRVHREADSASVDISPKMEAKLTIGSVLSRSTGITREILLLMIDGYTQSEVATELGVSRQNVSQALMKLREEYNV